MPGASDHRAGFDVLRYSSGTCTAGRHFSAGRDDSESNDGYDWVGGAVRS